MIQGFITKLIQALKGFTVPVSAASPVSPYLNGSASGYYREVNQEIWNVYRAAAQNALDRGDLARAEEFWLAALEQVEDDLGVDSRLMLTLENLASVLWYQERYAQAAPIMRRLLAIYRSEYGEEHIDVGIIANNTAMLYHAWGKHKEAEPFYKTALEIKRQALGEDHPDVVAILGNYANLLIMLNRELEAYELLDFIGELEEASLERSRLSRPEGRQQRR